MMRNTVYRLIKPFLIVALSFILITACYNLIIQNFNVSTQDLGGYSKCRVVQHKLGETCIPITPQRIIALDPASTLDPLLALGITPVGTSVDDWQGKRNWGGLSSDEVAGIEVIGQAYQPSLERILMLKPDLILGTDNLQQYYKQLSAISPTILLDYNKEVKLSFKHNFKSIAYLVGREEKGEQVLAQYQKRIEKLEVMIGDKLEGKEVSVITHYGNHTFWIPASYAVFFQVLNDLGVRLKPIFIDKSEWSTSSIETIDEYDADVLFIADGDSKTLSFFLKNPLFSSLKSAQNKQLYVVNLHVWHANGPLGISHLLDDLEKYLSNMP